MFLTDHEVNLKKIDGIRAESYLYNELPPRHIPTSYTS